MLARRKFCLIRISDYVELRSTIRGIKKVKSRLLTDIPGYGPFEMSQVCYDGGRVLGLWDYRSFVGTSGIAIKEDGFKVIDRTTALALQKKVPSWE